MKKATLTIAALICLFAVVADMPEASLFQFVAVKGVALASFMFFVRRLERVLPKEEV